MMASLMHSFISPRWSARASRRSTRATAWSSRIGLSEAEIRTYLNDAITHLERAAASAANGDLVLTRAPAKNYADPKFLSHTS